MHLETYLEFQEDQNAEVARSVERTLEAIVPNYIRSFSFAEHLTGLLLGKVQSGKTGQMLGIAAAAADNGFELFLLLTTDNVVLQEQTFARAVSSLETFNVCSEDDEIRFNRIRLRKPTLVVLKKNSRVLDRWRNNLASSGFCEGRPIFIIDDEGDAASLNTKINQEEQSAINSHLQSIREMCASSYYLQVTATPQPILLQTHYSGFRPAFVHYFPPGSNYLGGNFFYPETPSYTTVFTDEDELTQILNNSLHDPAPQGLIDALLTFLVTAAHIKLVGGLVCNFLIHPSHRILHQEQFEQTLRSALNDLLQAVIEGALEEDLLRIWEDLHHSKPELKRFDAIEQWVHNILEIEGINTVVMNSTSRDDISVTKGVNIIIGGNSLGRGVTFPGLQTVYYCRRARTPQADTFWQHCRMFGYDRDPDLMRIFIPPTLYNLFSNLNSANEALINQINNTDDISSITILQAPGIRPTRPNVVYRDALLLFPGGTNFFPNFPNNEYLNEIDKILEPFEDSVEPHIISSDLAKRLLELVNSNVHTDWNSKDFISAINAVHAYNGLERVHLIVRRGRRLSKGTGTMLSENDRLLGRRFSGEIVLTLYRNEGGDYWEEGELPVWIPNFKLPEGINYYKSDH